MEHEFDIRKALKKCINLLESEDDDDSEDDMPDVIETRIVVDKNRNEVGLHEEIDTFDDYVIPQYQFPYEDYRIVGDTGLIDKIIHTLGRINIEVNDVTTTLSKDTLNYVTVGEADNIAEALERSVENLPIMTDCVERMLFQILTPHGHTLDTKSMTEFIRWYNDDIDLIWGIAHDESLTDSIKVILIASSK